MTNEEALEILKSIEILSFRDKKRKYFMADVWKAKKVAIKALEQQPCEDCISRESVYELLAKEDWADTVIGIKELPSVTPQQKVGYWEYVQYDNNPNIGNWHCSECRTIIPHMPVETDRTPIYKWCPMCGANMEVEE